MQDESQSDDRIFELIAKAFDEPLSPAEQAQVDAAMQESPRPSHRCSGLAGI